MSSLEKIVLFGTGSGGEFSYYSLKDKFNIIGFCDNDEKKQGSYFLGKKIYSPRELNNLYFDYIFICSLTYRNQITDQLKHRVGVDGFRIMFLDDEVFEIKYQADKKTSFSEKLFAELNKSQLNEYRDNFDERRFGKLSTTLVADACWRLRRMFKKFGLFHRSWLAAPDADHLSTWMNLLPDLEWLYHRLEDDASRNLLVQIAAFRIMGHKAVKLPLAYTDFKSRITELDKLQDPTKSVEINFLGEKRQRYFFDYSSIGYPIAGFLGNPFTQFILEQYAHHDAEIIASPGDIVIDGGGCFGETSLYFGCKVGSAGQVHSFEFVPSNVRIFKENLKLNPAISERVYLAEKALWHKTDETLFISDRGPATKVSSEKKPGFDNTTETVSIDNYAEMTQLLKIDFIKLDIEGAEEQALIGAEKTIKSMKPKMAVCLYHSPMDFIKIPKLLDAYCPDYKFYLKHCTIHREETVLFAKA